MHTDCWIGDTDTHYSLLKQLKNNGKKLGTYKVRNEIETKRNETKSTKTKRNETKSTKTKRNETKSTKWKRNQRKQNEINENKTK